KRRPRQMKSPHMRPSTTILLPQSMFQSLVRPWIIFNLKFHERLGRFLIINSGMVPVHGRSNREVWWSHDLPGLSERRFRSHTFPIHFNVSFCVDFFSAGEDVGCAQQSALLLHAWSER
ncbi:hypothetical protein AAMO2058_000758400, partial [Amorphochlora amoebiformis]